MKTNELIAASQKLHDIRNHIASKYYEVDEFVTCLMLSMISRTHMIVLGEPGIAKSAILREFVAHMDFDQAKGTPYFHIQMGADISPNNIFGAPDIAYFKTHGIIKRHYKGFLPDAVIAFCSEFYRVSDQVANSGLLTILNEGEFKNGTETIKTNLRFFMADTNFFPKQKDDLDAEEVDFKLQALHDRFLARYHLKPLKDPDNKVKMILMDDDLTCESRIKLSELMLIQDELPNIKMSSEIARSMVTIATQLEGKHNISISPRRLKLSRNLVKANAIFEGRTHCIPEDLNALQFSFWQKEEDIPRVKEVIYETLDKPGRDAKKYEKVLTSILDELDRHIENQKDFPNFDIDKLYKQALSDLMKLIENISTTYKDTTQYPEIKNVLEFIDNTYKRLTNERMALKA